MDAINLGLLLAALPERSDMLTKLSGLAVAALEKGFRLGRARKLSRAKLRDGIRCWP